MEIIVTTEEKLEEIIKRCIKESTPTPTTTPEQPKYLHSILELAKFLHCSPLTAQKLKSSGKIRYRQYNRKCMFNTSEIMEDLAAWKPRK